MDAKLNVADLCTCCYVLPDMDLCEVLIECTCENVHGVLHAMELKLENANAEGSLMRAFAIAYALERILAPARREMGNQCFSMQKWQMKCLHTKLRLLAQGY